MGLADREQLFDARSRRFHAWDNTTASCSFLELSAHRTSGYSVAGMLQYQPAHDLPQLPHVAAPRGSGEELHATIFEPVGRVATKREEVCDEKRDIARALTQRW